MPFNDTKIHRSGFDKGINQDIEEHLTPTGAYRDALNVSITSDGKFFAVKNIKGTAHVANLMSASGAFPDSDEGYNILGSFSVNGKDSSGNRKPAIVYLIVYPEETIPFVATYIFDILMLDTSTNTVYLMYRKELSYSEYVEYVSATADAVVYSESGTDFLYVTDGVLDMYKIPCIFEEPAVTQTYLEDDISLTRRKNSFVLDSFDIGSSGSLPCGSYQIAMRLVNKELAKYTDWTILSTPISLSEYETETVPHSSIGGNSNKNIDLNWTYLDSADQEQINHYDYFEILIIPHISGSSTPDQNAYIISPLLISDYKTGFDISYNIESIDNAIEFDANDILIDDAAIKIVKTLAIKNNRLIGGNVEYHDLDYDNLSGKPVIVSSQFIYKEPADSTYRKWSDKELSENKGYFRDEVYRFAVSYVDKYGNWSNPTTLDTSSVTYGVNGVDIKFPGRNTFAGALWQTSTGNIRSIGIQFTINNHPTWAVGMAIFRVKRIKNIIAQTPIVPSILVQPAEALNNYPTIYKESVGGADIENESAQPPNPIGTLMPKNYMHGYAKSIVRDRFGAYADVDQAEVAYTKTYDPQNGQTPFVVYDGSDDHYQCGYVHFVYPPELLYGNGQEKYDSIGENYSLKLRTVDSALLRLEFDNITDREFTSGGDIPDGDFIETFGNAKAYATDMFQMYYHGSQTNNIPSIISQTDIESIDKIGYGDESFLITSSRNFRANSGGLEDSVYTSSVMDYSSLDIGSGSDIGVVPTPQECFVIVTKDRKPDITHFSYTSDNEPFYNSSIEYGAGGFQIDSSLFNVHVNDFIGESTPVIGSAVEIANIEKGLSDGRYGKPDTFHQYIFTGAYTDITNPNTQVNINVWGGDCYVGQYTFKLTDGTYSVTQAEKADSIFPTAQGIIDRWGRYYDNGAVNGVDVSRPVPLKGVSQLLSVILESEINPNGIDYNTNIEASKRFADPEAEAGGDIKIPFSYKHNMSTSVQSDLKIWVNSDELDRDLSSISSRIIYSDTKIYNSDIEGFDRFRAASFYDLDESVGDIKKLIVSNNRLFAIQEYGYAYVPFEIQVVETADASSLAISSGNVTGTPIYVSTSYGSQHARTVKEDRGNLFFFDFKNKVLIKHTEEGMSIISDNGLFSSMNDIVGTLADPKLGYSESSLHAILDKKNRLYILANRYNETNSIPSFAYVWDDKIASWVARWCYSDNNPSIWSGTTDTQGRLILTGKIAGSSNPIKIGRMYDGDLGSFFDDEQDSYVKFIINPEPEIPKTFDSFVINSSNRLDYIYLDVPRPDGTIQKAGTAPGVYGMDIDTPDIEGLFKIKVIRDYAVLQKQRMRGTYGIGQINFKNKQGLDSGTESALAYVLTRYRPSYRAL